jgi:hypothetical protein
MNKTNEIINKIDPNNNIRYIVEDTVKRTPLLNGNTIGYNIESIEVELSNIAIKVHEINLKQTENEIKNLLLLKELQRKNELLELEIKLLKEYLDSKNNV